MKQLNEKKRNYWLIILIIGIIGINITAYLLRHFSPQHILLPAIILTIGFICLLVIYYFTCSNKKYFYFSILIILLTTILTITNKFI